MNAGGRMPHRGGKLNISEAARATVARVDGLRSSGWFKPFRNAGKLLVGRAGRGVFTVAYLAVAARVLGIEDFGALMLIQTLTLTFGGVMVFPSWQAIFSYGTPALVEGNRAQFHKVLKFAVILDLVGAALGVVAVLLLMEPAAGLVGIPETYHGAARLYGLTVVLMALGNAPDGVLRMLERFDLMALQTVITPGTRLVGALGLLFVEAGLAAFLLVWFVSWLIGQAYLLLRAIVELKRRGLLKGAGWGLKGAWKPASGIWRFSVYANLNTTLTLVEARLGILAAGWMLGPAAAGLLRIAAQLANLAIRPVVKLLLPALYPELSRLRAEARLGELKTMMGRTILVVTGTGALFIAILAVFGEDLIRLIAGAGFESAYGVMLWLAAGGVLAAISTPIEPLLMSSGRPRTAVIAKAAAAATYAASVFGFLHVFGLAGAGMAFVSYAVVLGLGFGQAAYRLRLGGRS